MTFLVTLFGPNTFAQKANDHTSYMRELINTLSVARTAVICNYPHEDNTYPNIILQELADSKELKNNIGPFYLSVSAMGNYGCFAVNLILLSH
jgi:hypothetical protein